MLGALLLQACDREPARVSSDSPAEEARTASAASTSRSKNSALSGEVPDSLGSSLRAQLRSLSSDSAFELEATPEGAVLAWVEAGEPGMQVRRFNRFGSPQEAVALSPSSLDIEGPVHDLTLAVVGDALDLAWVEGGAAQARVRATRIAPDASRHQVYELGPGFVGPSPSRGNLAIGTDPRGTTVFSRGRPEPCVEPGEGDCFGFEFHRLTAGGASDRGFALNVPVPCSVQSTQLLLGGAPWHYGVCTRQAGTAMLTVFSLQPEPEYASSQQLFQGCQPLGLAAFGGTGAAFARCGPERRVAILGASDQPATTMTLPPEPLGCQEGRAVLNLGDRVRPVGVGQNRLELILPASLLEPGIRAVWTGRALLTGVARSRTLLVRRYECGERGLRKEQLVSLR